MKRVKLTFITNSQTLDYIMPNGLVEDEGGLDNVLAGIEQSINFIYANANPKVKFNHLKYNTGIVVKDIVAMKYEVFDDGT
jgi:hypothetical protein